MAISAYTQAPECLRIALLSALEKALLVENSRRVEVRTKRLGLFKSWKTMVQADGGSSLARKLSRALNESLYNDDRMITSLALQEVVDVVLRPRLESIPEYAGEPDRILEMHRLLGHQRLNVAVAKGLVDELLAQEKGGEIRRDAQALMIGIRRLLKRKGELLPADRGIALLEEIPKRRKTLGLSGETIFREVMLELAWLTTKYSCEVGSVKHYLRTISKVRIENRLRDEIDFHEWKENSIQLLGARVFGFSEKEAQNANMKSGELGLGVLSSEKTGDLALVLMINDYLMRTMRDREIVDLTRTSRTEAEVRIYCAAVSDIDNYLALLETRPGLRHIRQIKLQRLREIEAAIENLLSSTQGWDREIIKADCVLALARNSVILGNSTKAGAWLTDALQVIDLRNLAAWADWYMLAGRYFKAVGLSDRKALSRASQVYGALGNERRKTDTTAAAVESELQGIPGFQGSDKTTASRLLRFVEGEEPPCLSGGKKSKTLAERKGG